jgi:DNA-binding transcriptional regulator YiaG
MNEALELHNNRIIFSRAAAIYERMFGLLSKKMIKDLRKCFLKPSWLIEARHFRMTRDILGLSQPDIAESLNISIADLRKLEVGVDFFRRDVIANQLKSYLQLPLN